MPIDKSLLTESDLYRHLLDEVFTSAHPERDRVGIEVEYFPVRASRLRSGGAQPDREAEGDFIGLYPWLTVLAERYGWKPAAVESQAAIAFLLPGGGRVTLEPGGQIEYSTPPHDTAAGGLEDAERFERLLIEEGEKVGLIFPVEGFNRHLGSEAPRLVVRKPRYIVMDRHFDRIGPYGRMMMRQTCATQINLDFGPPEIAVERWRLANLAAPALNALFANSPFDQNGERYRSFRYEIWRNTDPCRTDLPYGLVASDDPVSLYLRFALDATVLLISDPTDGFREPSRPLTFREWMTDGEPTFPDLEDWRTHLSTLFPDVRPRGFIEVRSIDALPAAERRVAVELVSGLLYNEPCRRRGLALFEDPSFLGKGNPHASREDRFVVGRRLMEIGLEEMGSEVLGRYYDDTIVRAGDMV